MFRNEAQTRLDLIDPALFQRGWERGDIRVEETARAVDIDPVTKEARRRLKGRTDYVLRKAFAANGEPLPLAILEAKREGLPPEHGMQQGQDYRIGHLHHVPFVFSSNGHLFVEFDVDAGTVSAPRPMVEFNLYSAWVKKTGAKRCRKFAFKCMASTEGQSLIPDFRGSATSWFIATTKDLLTTGVDVPRVRNVVFFRYLQSPILLTQMVGRGTRLHEESGKLLFRIFDYTGATALLGADFITRPPSDSGDGTGPPRPPKVRATGLTTEVRSAGHFTVAHRDGRMVRVTWQEYEKLLVDRLLAAVPTMAEFHHAWLDATRRQDLLLALAAENLVPSHIQSHRGMNDYDLYDVLAAAAYGVAPRTRLQRAAAFAESASPPWLIHLPQPAAKVIRAIVRQFEKGGTEALDSKELFSAPEVKAAKGLAALKQAGNPHDILRQTRETIFVA